MSIGLQLKSWKYYIRNRERMIGLGYQIKPSNMISHQNSEINQVAAALHFSHNRILSELSVYIK